MLIATEQHQTPVLERVGALEEAFLRRLHDVFNRLRAAGIGFCILRNRDRIPWSLVSGSDVDVIVPGGTKARKIISLMMDLSPALIVPHKATLEMYFPVQDRFLHVDFLIADRQWRGAVYLKNVEILADARDDEGLPVASPLHQAFCAWFSSLTRKRVFKERYIQLISSALSGELETLLHRAFGADLGNELLALAKTDRLEQCNRLAGRCRRAIWKRAFVRRPLATTGGFIGYYLAEMKLYLRPTGMTVAVLGPDGAGKSTVCALLGEMNRAQLPFSAVEVQHMYERALPRLSELKKGRIRRTPLTSAATHDPHGKTAHNLIASIFSLFYTAIDQWISRIFLGRLKMSRNALILNDRHVLEIVVDSKRFRYGGPRGLARLFMRLVPRPNLTVLLDAPPQVLQSRKREVPFEETSRQRDAYVELVSAMSGGRCVSAVDAPPVVAENVRQIIVQHMRQETAGRFRI